MQFTFQTSQVILLLKEHILKALVVHEYFKSELVRFGLRWAFGMSRYLSTSWKCWSTLSSSKFDTHSSMPMRTTSGRNVLCHFTAISLALQQHRRSQEEAVWTALVYHSLSHTHTQPVHWNWEGRAPVFILGTLAWSRNYIPESMDNVKWEVCISQLGMEAKRRDTQSFNNKLWWTFTKKDDPEWTLCHMHETNT